MSKACFEVLTKLVEEHHAFQAWRELHSNASPPSSIEVLQLRKRAAVFRLNGVGPDGSAIIAKRCIYTTGAVERVVYTELLPRIPVRSLGCYGFLREPDGQFCWLFLEDACSTPYSPDVAGHRAVAAHWLGEAHLAPIPAELKSQLPDRELRHYCHLLQHCRDALFQYMACTPLSAQQAAAFCDLVTFCDALEADWDAVEKICDPMPRSLVHGDFVNKNVRVQNGAIVPALLVFDWQYAGWGVPATDLAQSIRGVISPDLTVYHSVLARAHPYLDLGDIERVAVCGCALRMLDEVAWAVLGLRLGDPRASSKAVGRLQAYQQRTVEVARRLEMQLS